MVTAALLTQTWGLKAQAARVIGEVTAKDAASNQLILKADSGSTYTVTLADSARLVRVAPGETSLKNAAPITAADINTGDRVMARGAVSEGTRAVSATLVVVMTKSDLAQKHQREREEWQRRGTTGLVKSISPDGKSVIIASRGRDGEQQIAVELTPETTFLRYAPDSVRFADAKPSNLAEIHAGDQVRVLGDKTPDGGKVTADQVVSGAFRTIGGTVISVDAAKGEILLKDLDTKKQVTIRTNADSQLRKLTPQAAMILAMRLNPEAAAAVRANRQTVGAANGGRMFQRGSGGPTAGERPRWGGAGGPDVQQMLERMPAFTLAELKPGEPLIVASTVGAIESTMTAITVLDGVEPILRAAPRGQLALGAWSLEMQMPE